MRLVVTVGCGAPGRNRAMRYTFQELASELGLGRNQARKFLKEGERAGTIFWHGADAAKKRIGGVVPHRGIIRHQADWSQKVATRRWRTPSVKRGVDRGEAPAPCGNARHRGPKTRTGVSLSSLTAYLPLALAASEYAEADKSTADQKQ